MEAKCSTRRAPPEIRTDLCRSTQRALPTMAHYSATWGNLLPAREAYDPKTLPLRDPSAAGGSDDGLRPFNRSPTWCGLRASFSAENGPPD